MSQEIDKPSGQDKGAKSADKPASSYSTPAGSRKVDDWASQFQNKDEGEALVEVKLGNILTLNCSERWRLLCLTQVMKTQ
jgi:hypothetical protein